MNFAAAAALTAAAAASAVPSVTQGASLSPAEGDLRTGAALPGAHRQPERDGNRLLLPKDAVLVQRGANMTKYHGVYIPSSQCFFCICLKCGTTSLFQYIYGATHGESWCSFAHREFGESVEGCEGTMMSSSLQASLREIGIIRDEQGAPAPLPRLPTSRSSGRARGGVRRREQPVTGLHELSAQDNSEMIHEAYWGHVFAKSTTLPDNVWDKAYKHAIVRDPVQRLISAWVNKLSCGLYSVPAGRDGGLHNGKTEREAWRSVVESTNEQYAASLASVSGVSVVQRTYQAPCNVPTGGKTASRPACNFTTGTCKSLSIEQFADAMVKVYARWAKWEKKGWDYTEGRLFSHALNGHFAPQVGHGSCFSHQLPGEVGTSYMGPEAYDTVSTISDRSKMRTFSEHLPAHKLGLWGDQHSNNNGGNVYFEGKKFVVPASVIKKLKKATAMEFKVFGKYL
jgi:hypothetical protein